MGDGCVVVAWVRWFTKRKEKKRKRQMHLILSVLFLKTALQSRITTANIKGGVSHKILEGQTLEGRYRTARYSPGSTVAAPQCHLMQPAADARAVWSVQWFVYSIAMGVPVVQRHITYRARSFKMRTRGPAVRADFRRLYPANAKTPTCCPSDDNRTKVTNSVTSARSLWWHVVARIWRGRRTPL